MAKLAGIFVSTRNLKLIGLAVWVASFIGVALLLAAFSYMQVREAMRQDAQVGLEQFASKKASNPPSRRFARMSRPRRARRSFICI